MQKPIVDFSFGQFDEQPLNIGARVLLVPLNHPESRLNGKLCETSPIVKVLNPIFPKFETENTIYQAVED